MVNQNKRKLNGAESPQSPPETTQKPNQVLSPMSKLRRLSETRERKRREEDNTISIIDGSGSKQQGRGSTRTELPESNSSRDIQKQVGSQAPDDGSGSDTSNNGSTTKKSRNYRGLGSQTTGSYFSQKQSTSAKTVTDLGVSLADEAELRKRIATLPERLTKEKASLMRKYESMFPEFVVQMRAGFNLLLYGFGSKFGLLKKMAKECTAGFPTIFINGLSNRVHARSILMNVAGLVKDCKAHNFKQLSDEEILNCVQEDGQECGRVFVFISNIDGYGLRDSNQQRMLSELASLPHVHIVASIDHINSPLLWDLQTKDRFGWLWHHVPTYQPYHRECTFSSLPSLLLGRREACTQESASVVLSSLSHSAREVFRCIADAQLDPEGNHGITFQRLYTVCREKFLASNEALLKVFLTEFKDHDILQTRKSPEGVDILCIPLDEDAIRQLLNELS